jgi:hypothetical protein
MGQVTTVGLDIAKSIFQVHGFDASGEVVVRRRLTRGPRSAVFREALALLGWNRSVCDLASLGA